jgi:hypothetical protein
MAISKETISLCGLYVEIIVVNGNKHKYCCNSELLQLTIVKTVYFMPKTIIEPFQIVQYEKILTVNKRLKKG